MKYWPSGLPSFHAPYTVCPTRLRKNWTITRVRDYIDGPKADGYRALHLINRNRGRLIEVQLRTPRQDLWANTVETFARTVAPGLKFGDGPEELRDYFVALGEFFAARDSDLPVDLSLLDRLEAMQRRVDTFVDGLIDEP